MTRIALISDAHGNAVGLRAALDDLAGRNVDAVVSLGDLAQGGPQPVECLDLVREVGARTVMGNADAFMLGVNASPGEKLTERHVRQREWTLGKLTERHLAYIRTFEPTVELDLDGRRLLCFHGTPASYDEPVLPEESPDAFAGTGADVLTGGHLHVPQLRRVGTALYVNPGSVGLGYDHLQPKDDFRFDPWASYAILEGATAEFHRVPFDVEELAHATRAGAMPLAVEELWRWQPRQT